MASDNLDLDAAKQHIRRLERRLQRSETARQEAEGLLLSKSRDLTAARERLAEIEERTLARLEREKETLLRAQYLAQVATFQFDSVGNIITSSNLRDVLGAAKEVESIDQLVDMLHPLETLPVERLLSHVEAGGFVGDQTMRDTRFLDQDGETRWLRWNLSQTKESSQSSDSENIITYGAVRNITQERQTERREKALRVISDRRLNQSEQLSEALHEKSGQLTQQIAELEAVGEALTAARTEADEANKSKSRFLAMMSHDIRTPLNAIMAIFELLMVSTSDQKQLELLQTASTSGDQLLFLLADIIQYARSDGWQVKPDIKTFQPRPFLETLVNSWRQLARKKSLQIQLVMAADLPDAIRTDPVRLRQIADNFLSNAIKYSHHGVISLNAEMKWDREEPHFLLSVYDEGPGIAEDQRSRIFQAFDRGGITIESGIEGTGLGLAICQRITKALGGSIGTESNAPTGSIFWIECPVTIGNTDELPAKKSIADKGSALFDEQYALKILVAEDVAANQMVMGNMLTNFGVDYDFADDGPAAVEMAQSGSYDAIFMDISMPKMNGMDAARAIIKAMKQEAPMIFAVTAFSSAEERKAIIASGMDGIVSKPISSRTIESVLQQINNDGQAEHSVVNVPDDPVTIENNLPIPEFEDVGVIEISRLEDMFGGMEQNLQERLVQAVEADLKNYFSQFEDAVNATDGELIAKSHHALKGLCSGFGAHALLAKLEGIRENPGSNTSAKLDEAKANLEETLLALQQFLAH